MPKIRTQRQQQAINELHALIAMRLRREIKDAGYSVTSFCKAGGFSHSSIQQVLSETQNLTTNRLARICNVLKIHPTTLLQNDAPKRPFESRWCTAEALREGVIRRMERSLGPIDNETNASLEHVAQNADLSSASLRRFCARKQHIGLTTLLMLSLELDCPLVEFF